VLNPSWEVPNSIAVKEMLPRARRNPGYFSAQGLQLLPREGEDRSRRIDSDAVDWNAVDARNFPYRVRQPPGPKNPMGRIKFVFRNPFGVYLHGTPGRTALEQPMRALSHGCVRVADEVALASWALAPDPAWSRERLVAELETAREERVPLHEPLPVHLLYFTAEADPDGEPAFYDDPYGWDPPLRAALATRAAPPAGQSRQAPGQ